MSIYQDINNGIATGKKKLSVLIDPGKMSDMQTTSLVNNAQKAGADYFFIGGSLLTNDNFEKCIQLIKHNSDIPVIIFPGNGLQISNKADGILFLSLISGRNAEMLIGRQVITAPYLKQTKLEVISTGYMLIESGTPTTVSYMSNTTPIPHDKDEIAMCTAMAGEMLGLKLIFMDGGSGANKPISTDMIKTVKHHINIPLIVGGGIRTPEKAKANCDAGADIIVVGNAFEKDQNLLSSISAAVHS